jgi:hypothetical protein
MKAAAEQARLQAMLPPGPLVVRWNLRSGWIYEQAKARCYPFDRLVDEERATRAALVALVRRTISNGHSAFVIANNKDEGSAPLIIVKLAEAIAEAR